MILITFPKLHWLHERASVLRYTYIAWLVGSNRPPVSSWQQLRSVFRSAGLPIWYGILMFHCFPLSLAAYAENITIIRSSSSSSRNTV